MPEAIFVTVNEAAEMLALSKWQVYELAASGLLGPRRFVGSRNFRLEAEAVRAYAQSLPSEPKTA